jgi:hypothetical protein
MRHAGCCATERRLRHHLENEFQLDRRAERHAGDAGHQAARVLVFSEEVLQQLGSAVSDFGLVAEVARGYNRNAEPDDARHLVERPPMLARDSEAVERREVSCIASGFHVEFRSDAPNEFRASAFGGKHPGEKQQIARLHRFRIGAERFRRRRELDVKLLQTLLCTGLPRLSGAYHCQRARRGPCAAPPRSSDRLSREK